MLSYSTKDEVYQIEMRFVNRQEMFFDVPEALRRYRPAGIAGQTPGNLLHTYLIAVPEERQPNC
jgi:hypothetical protein